MRTVVASHKHGEHGERHPCFSAHGIRSRASCRTDPAELGRGNTILYDQVDRAYYGRAEDRIHLPPKAAFRDAAAFYRTALHELAHYSGHPSRLNGSH